jgi:methyl-accepting chemotaxis protein
MEEQNAGSRQILDAIGNVNSITRQVSEGAARMQAGSAEVMAGARDLEGVTAEITGGMEEMSSGAVQMNNALIRVQELTGKNKEDIGVLVQEVARFKVA